MLQNVTVNTEAAARVVEVATGQIEGLITRAKGLAATITALGASYLTLNELRHSWEAFSDQQTMIIQFNAAIRGHGHDVEALTAQYKGFAKELSESSASTERDIMRLLSTAESRFRVTSGSAEKAVKDATHIAAMGKLSSDAALRLTTAVARGDEKQALQFSRLLTGGRGGGFKDFKEFMAEYEKQLAAGTQASEEMSKTTRNQLMKLRDEYRQLLVKVGDLVDGPAKRFVTWLREAMQAVLAFIDRNQRMPTILEDMRKALYFVTEGLKDSWDWLGKTGKAVLQFVEDNKRLFEWLGLVTGAVLAGVVVFKLGAAAIGLVTLAYTALHVEQVVGIAIWLAWTAVVGAAKIVMFLFNAQMVVYEGLITAASFLTGIFTSTEWLATLGTWLWNAALTVLNFLIGNIPLVVAAAVAAILTFATGGVALIFLAGAAMGAWTAISGLFDALEKAPASGALSEIGDVIGGWGGMFRDVGRAATVNMDLAWKVIKLSAAVVVEDLKKMWPPVWTFVREGWHVASIYAANSFRVEMHRAILDIWFGLSGLIDPLGILTGKTEAQMTEARKKINEEAAKQQEILNKFLTVNLANSLRNVKIPEDSQSGVDAKNKLKAATDLIPVYQKLGELQKQLAENERKFYTSKAGEEEEKARAAVEGVRNEIDALNQRLGLAAEKWAPLKKGADDTHASAEKARKSVEHLTHALAGTAEEQRRIEHQRNIFEAANEDKSKSREDKVGNAAAASTAESNRKIETNTNKMVDFMKEQDDREKAKAGANKPEIAVADLGSWY